MHVLNGKDLSFSLAYALTFALHLQDYRKTFNVHVESQHALDRRVLVIV